MDFGSFLTRVDRRMGGVLSFIFGVYLVFTFVIKYLLSRFLKPIFCAVLSCWTDCAHGLPLVTAIIYSRIPFRRREATTEVPLIPENMEPTQSISISTYTSPPFFN